MHFKHVFIYKHAVLKTKIINVFLLKITEVSFHRCKFSSFKNVQES